MLRFASSPSEDMHIGDLRVALVNHILSKQLNEDMIIRIDDTDNEKNIKSKDKEILEILNLFSIDYTRVVHQSDNIKYHTQMAMKLLLDKKAFNCYCSDDALELDKQKAEEEGKPYGYNGFCETISDEAKFNCNAPFTVRIKKPERNITFKDTVKGNFEYKPFDVDSFVILEHNKTPTYNFACAVDDMLHNISTVIITEDHLLDTPKQIHIRKSLGYDQTVNYIHLPVILNPEKEKSSLSVRWLIDEGYLPSAIANYIVHLGYNPPKKIFTIEEAIEWFDISKISHDPVKFDLNELKLLNKEHLKTMDELRLSKILGYADTDFGKLAKVYLEECDTIKQLKEKLEGIFGDKKPLDSFETQTNIVKSCLQMAPFIPDFNDLVKYITDETGLKEENLLIPLRYILTGEKTGPNLSDIYPLIKNYLGEIVK